ncbi:hypothetical protein [Gracilibacillus timonensis]|uniref:hypothetical protein n=1 Tax=Gracilibacillus timonensis TaxID=1816696 RepID=UPI000824310C|nr:hypothetical protein [Gracilibacillus timonensis]
MPMQCDVTLESGLVVPIAYLSIVNFSGNDDEISCTLGVWLNKKTYRENKQSITGLLHHLEYDKDRNIYRQMYEHLHSLLEYEGAVGLSR